MSDLLPDNICPSTIPKELSINCLEEFRHGIKVIILHEERDKN